MRFAFKSAHLASGASACAPGVVQRCHRSANCRVRVRERRQHQLESLRSEHTITLLTHSSDIQNAQLSALLTVTVAAMFSYSRVTFRRSSLGSCMETHKNTHVRESRSYACNAHCGSILPACLNVTSSALFPTIMLDVRDTHLKSQMREISRSPNSDSSLSFRNAFRARAPDWDCGSTVPDSGL